MIGVAADAPGESFAAIRPAFPENGRQAERGIHPVNGNDLKNRNFIAFQIAALVEYRDGSIIGVVRRSNRVVGLRSKGEGGG
jgi:uncharacterized protein YgbK (DUF1537 family)